MPVKILIRGYEMISQETCILGVFEEVSHENFKKHGNHPQWEYNTTLRKTCLLSVFELLT